MKQKYSEASVSNKIFSTSAKNWSETVNSWE